MGGDVTSFFLSPDFGGRDVVPEVIEVVMQPSVFLENMNDDRTHVDQNPGSRCVSLRVFELGTVFPRQRISQALRVPGRGRGHDDEIVREAGALG